jgi:CRP-like cAMP-binding protein
MDVVTEASWLSATDLAALRQLGSRRALRTGSTIFMEGDEPHDVAVIESGDIKVVTSAPNGQELVLDVVGAGDLLGELSALDGSARSATAIALTDCEIVSIPVDRFLSYLQEHPTSMGALLAVVVRRLRLSNQRQLELSTSDALGRVCARLDEMASRYGLSAGDSVRIELSITQTELAQWCGLSREAVVKALRKLRDLGWVASTDGSIVIEQLDAVRARGAM